MTEGPKKNTNGTIGLGLRLVMHNVGQYDYKQSLSLQKDDCM